MPRGTEQKGVWLDERVPWTEERTLRVGAQVFFTGPHGHRVGRVREGSSGTAPRAARTSASGSRHEVSG